MTMTIQTILGHIVLCEEEIDDVGASTAEYMCERRLRRLDCDGDAIRILTLDGECVWDTRG